MKKSAKYLIILILVGILYSLFIFMIGLKNISLNKPEIIIPEGVIQVSVHDSKEAFFKGMSVIDKEDGDITSKLAIESITPFDENQQREVTFIVFDSDDNFTKATRKITYSDYQKPSFDIVRPLLYDSYYSDRYFDYLRVTSSVDGDLSYKILMENEQMDGISIYRTFSVTDSCGIKEKITLKITNVYDSGVFGINLSTLLLRVPLGTEINPYDYIEEIEYLGMINNELIYELDIQTDYNPNEPGVYEYVYNIQKNGDFGITKLTVIVE